MNLALQLFAFALTATALGHCVVENKLRESGKRDHRAAGLSEDESRQLGHRSPHFRYME